MSEIHHAYSLYSAPALEPLSCDEARAHLRVDVHDEDDLTITPLIKAARNYCEKVLDRALITQTWKLYLDAFPSMIELRKPPIQSVSGITYTDNDGATQTLSTSIYSVDSKSEPGRITLAYNQVFPTYRAIENSIVVTFVAGYGADGTYVPEPIKHAMKFLIGHWYRNREAVTPGSYQNIPQAVDALLASYMWGAYSP